MANPTHLFPCGPTIQFMGGTYLDTEINYFFTDFLGGGDHSATAELGSFLLTSNGAGATATYRDATDASQEQGGGWLVLTPGATASDSANATSNGEVFQLDQGFPLYFETKIYVGDISDVNVWVGLCQSDTEIINGGLAASGVGFEITGAATDAAIQSVVCNAGSETLTDTGKNFNDGDIWVLAFFYDGATTITFMAAEVSAATHTGKLEVIGTGTLATGLEDKQLCIALEVEDVAAAEALYVDYVKVLQPKCVIE